MKLLRFFLQHSLRDMWRNRSRTLFALICVATGVSAVVALRTISFMVQDELTTNLAELNRGDIRLNASRRVPEIVELSPQNEPVFTRAAVDLVREWAAREGVAVSEARTGSLVQVRKLSGGEVGAIGALLALYVDPATYPFYGAIILNEPPGATLNDVMGGGGEVAAWARGVLPQLSTIGIGVLPGGGMGQGASWSAYSSHTATHMIPVVISSKLTRSMGMGLKIGDVLRLGAADTLFVVSGIARSDSETLFTTPQTIFLDYLYVPFNALALQGEPALPNQIFLRVPLGRDISRAEEGLIEFLDRATGGDTDIDEKLYRTTVPSLEEESSEAADVIDDMILAMGLSSLLIGGIGIVNTMLVVVSRRTVEIAVLKTLGLKAYRVTQLFLVEALLMGLVGSLLGVVLGVALSYMVKGVGETAFSLSLEWRLYPEAMLSGVFLGVVVTGLFGFLPTLVAGQVRPAVVLRPNEAQMPAAGLIQLLVTLIVMIVVLGLLADSVVNDALTISPVYMLVGGGALVGLFGGVIVANTRLGKPLPDHYTFRLSRRYEQLDHWLVGGAGRLVSAVPLRTGRTIDRMARGRSAITAGVRTFRQIVLLYGAVAVGAALASLIMLILSEVWLPFGWGAEKPPGNIVTAWNRGAVGWVAGWALLTLLVAALVRTGGRSLGAIIGLGSLGATFGGAFGLLLGNGFQAFFRDTAIWSSLSEMATGVVLVEGALVILSGVYVGYWLLVWGAGKLPPSALIGLSGLVLVGVVLLAGRLATSRGPATLLTLAGTVALAMVIVRVRQLDAPSPGDAAAATGTRATTNSTGGRRFVWLMAAVLLIGILLAAGRGLSNVPVVLAVWFAGAALLWWRVGRRYHVDARLILREMSGRRSRVASTLLGLSVGIAGLSVVALSTNAATRLLEGQLGEGAEGNLLIVARQAEQGEAVRTVLEEDSRVQSFAQFTTYRGVLMAINGETVERPADQNADEEGNGEGASSEPVEAGVGTFLSERARLEDLPDYRMKSGRILDEDDVGSHRMVIRESFFTEELGIVTGDRLLYKFENQPGEQDDRLIMFTVVGIISRNSKRSGLDDFGDQFVVPPRTLSDEGVLPFYVVTVAAVDESSEEFMGGVLQRVADVPGTVAFELGALTQLVENLIEQLEAIPTLVAWLALVAGTAIIANTVALATQERRRQIGVMKAVGLKGRRVLGMLIIENGLIGLLAGLIGVGVGFLLTVVVVLASESPGELRDVIDVETMGWLLLMSIAVAVGAAILSAWNAAAEKPMNVLRYE